FIATIGLGITTVVLTTFLMLASPAKTLGVVAGVFEAAATGSQSVGAAIAVALHNHFLANQSEDMPYTVRYATATHYTLMCTPFAALLSGWLGSKVCNL
ncbi:hypothetical protein KIPB_016300, partial [Kipferlia bialata]